MKQRKLSAKNTPPFPFSFLNNPNVFTEAKPEDIDLFEESKFEDPINYYRLDREYKIEIEWNQFNEPQIQTLIAILFQTIGYSSENWHESDRAREEGADLVIKKSRETIAIAVKVKPKNKDRQQLSDLSKRLEKKKVYVYIETPSAKFRENMNDYKGNVEFWDAKTLNDFFVNNNLGFTTSLICDSNKLSATIRGAQILLFELRQKCRGLKKVTTVELDSQSFRWLFRLKDNGVSLNKTNENVILLLEKPINIKSRELDEHFLKLLIGYLDILDLRLVSFLHFFKLFYERNEDLVNNSIIENDARSHWLDLLQYQTDHSVPQLKKDLQEEIKYEKLLKLIKKKSPDKEEENYWKEKAKNNDVWAVMESRVRNLMIFGSAMEAIVDDIVDEYVTAHTKYQHP